MSLQANPNKTFQGSLSGTTGNTQAIIYTKFLDVEAASVFDYAIITTGFTVNISVSTSDPSSPSTMVWTTPTALTGIVGTTLGTRDRYSSGSFTGIKIDRTAGAGTFELVISTNGAAASGGTASNPSVVQGPAADNAAAVGNPVRIGAKYNLALQTYGDGDIADLQVNANGILETVEQYQSPAEDNTNGVIGTQNKPLAVATYTWSVDQSAALEASTITKSAPGVIRLVTGRINSTHATGTYYWHIWNASALPADGAVAFLWTPLKLNHTNGTDTNFSIDFTANGIFASVGIVMGLSTTEFTKTISGAFTSSTALFK